MIVETFTEIDSFTVVQLNITKYYLNKILVKGPLLESSILNPHGRSHTIQILVPFARTLILFKIISSLPTPPNFLLPGTTSEATISLYCLS